MYRTGDRGRWYANGNLEFIGRVDEQVKVQGVRVELAEIEAALRRHPHIIAAAAVIRGDLQERQIVAFVATSENFSGRDLRLFLSQRLPTVMLPAQILVRRELPLLPNGKVDREALAQTARQARPALTSFEAPRNATETALLHIWTEVMNGKRIGIDHDFFELGGDSLQATRVLVRIRERFGVDVSLHSLFEHPTISSLATLLNSAH